MEMSKNSILEFTGRTRSTRRPAFVELSAISPPFYFKPLTFLKIFFNSFTLRKSKKKLFCVLSDIRKEYTACSITTVYLKIRKDL